MSKIDKVIKYRTIENNLQASELKISQLKIQLESLKHVETDYQQIKTQLEVETEKSQKLETRIKKLEAENMNKMYHNLKYFSSRNQHNIKDSKTVLVSTPSLIFLENTRFCNPAFVT